VQVFQYRSPYGVNEIKETPFWKFLNEEEIAAIQAAGRGNRRFKRDYGRETQGR
jgi:hypothetical protein